MQQKPVPKQIKNYVYFLQNRLGKGSSSVVYLGQHILTNQPVAIKVIDVKSLKTDVERMLVGHQMKALKIMNHDNVIKAAEIYQTANNIYIIYEYCQLGDLQHHIMSKGRLSEQQATNILLQLLSGVIHIHSKGVVHRDLKPQNILLKNGSKDRIFKIIDFGFCEVSDSKLQQPYNVGSPLYMSPEAYKKSKYSTKSDCWALGVIFLEMLLGDLPFRGIEYDALVKQLSLAEPYKNLNCSSLTKILLNKMLAMEPQRRIQPAEAYNLIISNKIEPMRALGVSNQSFPQIPNQGQTNLDSSKHVTNTKNEFVSNEKNIRGSLVMNHSPIPKPKPRDISPAKLLERVTAYTKPKQTTIQQPQTLSPNRGLALNKIRLCEYFYSFLCIFEEAKSMFIHSQRIFLLSLKLIKLSLQSVAVMFQEEPQILTQQQQENLRNQISKFNETQIRYSHNTLFADLYFSFTLEYLRLEYQFLNYLQFWISATIIQMKKKSEGREKDKQCSTNVYKSYLHLHRLYELLEHVKRAPTKIQTLPENKLLDRLITDKSVGNPWQQIRHLQESGFKSMIV